MKQLNRNGGAMPTIRLANCLNSVRYSLIVPRCWSLNRALRGSSQTKPLDDPSGSVSRYVAIARQQNPLFLL